MSEPTPDFLRSFLADRDTPCPGCGYNLRRLTNPVCPECGDHLELRVNLAEPRLGSWIAGIIGAACGAGFNGLLLFYVAVMMVADGRRMGSLPAAFVVINFTGLAATGLCLLVWVRGRAKFRRAPVAVKAALILATWLLVAADVIVFALAIR